MSVNSEDDLISKQKIEVRLYATSPNNRVKNLFSFTVKCPEHRKICEFAETLLSHSNYDWYPELIEAQSRIWPHMVILNTTLLQDLKAANVLLLLKVISNS
jgi:hypothetical protein